MKSKKSFEALCFCSASPNVIIWKRPSGEPGTFWVFSLDIVPPPYSPSKFLSNGDKQKLWCKSRSNLWKVTKENFPAPKFSVQRMVGGCQLPTANSAARKKHHGSSSMPPLLPNFWSDRFVFQPNLWEGKTLWKRDSLSWLDIQWSRLTMRHWKRNNMGGWGQSLRVPDQIQNVSYRWEQ